MYTKEPEEIALKEYERLESVHAVIRRLSYPSKFTLYCWYESRKAGLENRHGHAVEIPEKTLINATDRILQGIHQQKSNMRRFVVALNWAKM